MGIWRKSFSGVKGKENCKSGQKELAKKSESRVKTRYNISEREKGTPSKDIEGKRFEDGQTKFQKHLGSVRWVQYQNYPLRILQFTTGRKSKKLKLTKKILQSQLI